ncbi:LPS-assembly protein LptD [Desulforegula conservatrix]|uniref:LPS-assembly protein LptD n=1 Tax=Desulforegula conservatrix TaxID=153026 RepID=UPI000426CB90|nr:LPS assembly protein LptD [Desulforegula conservatrix]
MCIFSVVIFFLSLSYAFSVHCEDSHDFFGIGNSDEKTAWQLFADRIVYEKDGLILLEGNAEITGENKNIHADYIKYDTVSKTALARGNVKMNWGKDKIESEALKLNIKEETGTIFDGHLFVEESHFYLKSSRLEKIADQRYVADNVLFSSCDGDEKDWQISGKNLDVTINGYGSMDDASLMAKDAPIAYSPYFFFPVKVKRQSGFLLPELGYSTRKGSEYQQPYYWAINDNTDATFYANTMTLRGIKTGLEYRYNLDKESLGILMAEYIDDQKKDNGSPESSNDWGYTHDTWDRENSDRYWIRMKADHQFSDYGLKGKLDLDFVSDQDYLLEFSGRQTGYDDTSGTYTKYFGRHLDGNDENVRLNRMNLSKTTEIFSLNTDVAWYDDVIARTQNVKDETIKYLPRMQFGTTMLPFGDSSLLASFGGNYTDFYSIDGKNGDRMSVFGEAHTPKQISNFLILDPYVGLTQTLWADRTEDRETAKDIHSRSIYNVGVNLGSRLSRTYNTDFSGARDLLHNIEPSIGFSYIPDKNQEVLPDFDGRDIIKKSKNITWSLTNTLIGADKDIAEEGITRFNRMCRLYFEQSYDINKAEEKNQQPFTPLLTELSITPYPNLLLEADSEWSVYDYDFVSHNIKMIIKSDSGHAALLEYRNTDKDNDESKTGIESFKSGLELAMTSQIKAYGLFEKDILNGKTIETVTGLRYSKQCWATDINYADKENEERITLLFSLSGLGDFGVAAPQL